MGPARHALLWASKNRWIERQFRRRAFARTAVSRFMPGEDLDSALQAARTLSTEEIMTVLTLLGENASAIDDAAQVTNHYVGVLDRIRDANLPTQISVKLTQLGLDLDRETAYAQLDTLLSHAADQGTLVWVDMEDSRYKEVTLALFERARLHHDNLGLCLQSYLRSCADDLERLLPLRPAIRLVKGAYREPATVAFPRKQDVDANYLAIASRLLEAVADGHAAPPAFATHDVPLLERILDTALQRGLDRRAFEVQMLFGIGRRHQRRLASEGCAVRVLISYGSAWFPWYMRRLAERPANIWFVFRSAMRR